MASSPEKIDLDDIIAFNGELAAILRAGIPLEMGLQGGRSQWKTSLARLGERLAVQMQQGKSLSEAIAEERSLPPVYRAVVTAGVRAGRLPQALEGLSRFADLVRQMRQRLSQSMIYPAFVLALAYVVWLVFLFYYIPEVVAMYTDMRRPTGQVLQFLHRLSASEAVWWWIPPVVAIAGLFSLTRGGWGAPGNRGGSLWGNWLGPLVVLPGMRRVARDYEIAGFSEIAGVLTANQVPLPEALDLAAGSLGDATLRTTTAKLIEDLRQGRPFVEAAPITSNFPPFLRWLIQTGILQNRLPDALAEGSTYYRRKADSYAGWLQFVVPLVVLIVVCGTVVALYALTVFVPFREMMLNLAPP